MLGNKYVAEMLAKGLPVASFIFLFGVGFSNSPESVLKEKGKKQNATPTLLFSSGYDTLILNYS